LSASRRWRKEAFGAPERRNPPRCARFETNRLRKESGFFPKGSGARIDSDRRRLWAKEIGVASRRAGGGGLGGSSPRSSGCEAGGREEGSRRRRQRRRSQTTSSSEYLDEWIERSRQSKLVCVNRRVSRTNRGRLRQIDRATEHGCREVERRLGGIRWLEVSAAPLWCRLERAGSKRASSLKEAAERGRRVAVAIGRKGTCARDFEGLLEKN
jgi:hypothetical protein